MASLVRMINKREYRPIRCRLALFSAQKQPRARSPRFLLTIFTIFTTPPLPTIQTTWNSSGQWQGRRFLEPVYLAHSVRVHIPKIAGQGNDNLLKPMPWHYPLSSPPENVFFVFPLPQHHARQENLLIINQIVIHTTFPAQIKIYWQQHFANTFVLFRSINDHFHPDIITMMQYSAEFRTKNIYFPRPSGCSFSRTGSFFT